MKNIFNSYLVLFLLLLIFSHSCTSSTKEKVIVSEDRSCGYTFNDTIKLSDTVSLTIKKTLDGNFNVEVLSVGNKHQCTIDIYKNGVLNSLVSINSSRWESCENQKGSWVLVYNIQKISLDTNGFLERSLLTKDYVTVFEANFSDSIDEKQ